MLGERETAFIGARDSFYMASVGETGWPYVQHRGGPAGFLRIVDEQTIGFADFTGNRQYISVGNFRKDDRVSLFLMDYPNRTRLKLLGRVKLIGPEHPALLAKLEVNGYHASVERGFLIQIEAFDWNCPQHITPRYADAEVDALMAPLVEENRMLKHRQRDHGGRTDTLGNGPLELVVTGIRQLTPRIRAYELSAPDGGELPVFQAGAHLQLPALLDNRDTVIRHYSISSSPMERSFYEIAVLREDDGTGGSLGIHSTFEVGLRIRCPLPRSHFSFHIDSRPGVLIAGGIGITPIKAIALSLKSRGNDVHLHYAGRSRKEMAFQRELHAELGAGLTTYSAADNQRLSIEQILRTVPAQALIYVCGPEPLIDAVLDVAAVLKIDPGRVRFERFVVTLPADQDP